MSLEKKFRQRLLANAKKNRLIDDSFPAQANFIRDPSRLKAAQCTRRAAKSYAAGIGLLEAALSEPGVSCLYLGLTIASAKNIMIKDILKPLNKKHNLGCKFVYNPSFIEVRIPNESIIYLTGVNAKEDEKDKIFGQKYKRIVVDEGGAFTINTEELIYQTLFPATADYGGDIWFTGMPTNRVNSFFKKVCDGDEPGWSVHKWSALENPYMKDKFQTDMDLLIEKNPLVVETPWFKQMYLNQWFIDTDALIYKYNETRNLVDELPQLSTPWNYILGVDLGFDDATAFTVLAWNEKSRELYGIESYKKSGFDFFNVADEINDIKQRYHFWKVIVDGSNKQGVETMKRRLGLPELQAAEKQGKFNFIDILNSEMIQGHIKVIRKKNDELIDEWCNLIRDPKKKERTELDACENHLCDAFLYAWRETYNYLFKPHVPEVKLTPVEKVDTWWEDQADQVEARKSSEFWEKDWK